MCVGECGVCVYDVYECVYKSVGECVHMSVGECICVCMSVSVDVCESVCVRVCVCVSAWVSERGASQIKIHCRDLILFGKPTA